MRSSISRETPPRPRYFTLTTSGRSVLLIHRARTNQNKRFALEPRLRDFQSPSPDSDTPRPWTSECVAVAEGVVSSLPVPVQHNLTIDGSHDNWRRILVVEARRNPRLDSRSCLCIVCIQWRLIKQLSAQRSDNASKSTWRRQSTLGKTFWMWRSAEMPVSGGSTTSGAPTGRLRACDVRNFKTAYAVRGVKPGASRRSM
eukprot:7382167-Prymnesium_polylepis.2